MRYYVFIDESGEANIKRPDPRFEIFVLCGVIFREDGYEKFDAALKELKRKHFGTEDIVFHSYKMRKQIGPFKIFQDKEVLKDFYVSIEKIFLEHMYRIVACIVDKENYRKKYPDKNFAYEDALTFLVERSISCSRRNVANSLHFCLETRSERKDIQLKKLYTKIVKYGTDYKSTADFQVCHPNLFFRVKEQNINGLQFADLCAFPIAIKTLSPKSRQPTYDLFENKIFSNWYGRKEGYGLKYFP
jgi:hypothetical protein